MSAATRRRNPLEGRRVALGVTGSIAAYKAVGIASSLVQQGAAVDVLMTQEAARLIQPLSFQAITHRPVAVDMFHLGAELEIGHVSIGHAAEALLVAPATAHSIAKLALGLADDMVTTTALATVAPCLLAPAMETNMWRHPATQGHVQTLRERGWTIVEPEAGYLASGSMGEGRLAAPETIVEVLKYVLARGGDLSGLRVAVTGGGTREPIDPVRYLSNRSSGKMGHAVAEAARDRGAAVTLITTADLPVPQGARAVRVEQAEEMRDAVLAALDGVDVLVMAAAVADYRPAEISDEKIKKSPRAMALDLSPTPDILVEAARRKRADGRPVIVGFAAETSGLRENAGAKLRDKGLDLVVANDVSSAADVFGSDYNAVTILRRDGTEAEIPRMSKVGVAHHLWDEVLDIVAGRTSNAGN